MSTSLHDLPAFADGGAPVEGWPLYESVDRQTKVYSDDATIVSDPEEGRRSAWKGFLGYP